MSSSIHTNSGSKARAKAHDTLDEAIYAVVHESAIPAKALASAVGVRVGYLLDAANPNRDDTQFQARLIEPLTKASGNDAIVRYICERVGGLFVRLPRRAGASDVHAARALKEFGEYLERFGDAMQDGLVSRAEFNVIEREATDVIVALLEHIEAMRAAVIEDTEIPSAFPSRRA
jgi:hypothetical protein